MKFGNLENTFFYQKKTGFQDYHQSLTEKKKVI